MEGDQRGQEPHRSQAAGDWVMAAYYKAHGYPDVDAETAVPDDGVEIPF